MGNWNIGRVGGPWVKSKGGPVGRPVALCGVFFAFLPLAGVPSVPLVSVICSWVMRMASSGPFPSSTLLIGVCGLALLG